jgi:hypothetical protein
MLLKQLLSIVQEADVVDAPEDPRKPQKTKTKTKTAPNLDHLNRTKPDQPLANFNKQSTAKTTTPQQNIASKGETRDAVRGITPNADAMKHLQDLHNNMPADDEQADADVGDVEPTEPPPPETLPKVISSAMKAAGFVDPNFHLVSNLPGNMSRAILQLGKALFKTFTTTPTEKISMIGNVMGQGPNSLKELNAVAAYLKKEGTNLGPGEVDFNSIMPGYTAQIHNFEAGGVHYMMVKDMMGDYIYTWPANTSVGHKNDAKLRQDHKRLK